MTLLSEGMSPYLFAIGQVIVVVFIVVLPIGLLFTKPRLSMETLRQWRQDRRLVTIVLLAVPAMIVLGQMMLLGPANRLSMAASDCCPASRYRWWLSAFWPWGAAARAGG